MSIGKDSPWDTFWSLNTDTALFMLIGSAINEHIKTIRDRVVLLCSIRKAAGLIMAANNDNYLNIFLYSQIFVTSDDWTKCNQYHSQSNTGVCS